MDSLRDFWRRVQFICYKEFLTTFKDPKSRIVLVFPVIVQSLLFGYVCNFNLDYVSYAVLDESHSRTSEWLLAKLDGTGIFRRTRTLDSPAQMAACIDDDAAMVVVHIERELEAKLNRGETAAVQVILDGRNSTTSGVAAGYVSNIITELNKELMGGRELLAVESRIWYNENQITRWTFLTGMMPMLCLSQIIMLAGLSVAREREQGTFDQLLVTPLDSLAILIGKAVPALCTGLFQAAVGMLICRFWFHIPLAGSVWLLFLALFIFILSVIGLGLSISAISDTMQQVLVYCFMMMMPLSLLSGMATPVRNMPVVLQYATYLNPLRFAISSVRRIYLEGCGFSVIWPEFVPMLLVAAVTLPLAAWMFRNKLS